MKIISRLGGQHNVLKAGSTRKVGNHCSGQSVLLFCLLLAWESVFKKHSQCHRAISRRGNTYPVLDSKP